ncbi:hypothetical protein QE152_g10056 [Popillia japonica]|uniref:NADH:ubiquinone reductase (H(+)-translocating) n=1 Tax=Popillia japonica TaxID=7064 RepID=A0AAW1LXR1_POPJA
MSSWALNPLKGLSLANMSSWALNPLKGLSVAGWSIGFMEVVAQFYFGSFLVQSFECILFTISREACVKHTVRNVELVLIIVFSSLKVFGLESYRI